MPFTLVLIIVNNIVAHNLGGYRFFFFFKVKQKVKHTCLQAAT